MDKLFEGINSGMVSGTPGDYIKTPDGLYAGFLVEQCSCGESRSYALFEVDKENGVASFNRFCKKPEKKLLAKAHYHFKALRNVDIKTDSGTCILFVVRY